MLPKKTDVTCIGFLVPHLGLSQLAYNLINNVNNFSIGKTDIDVVGFYQNVNVSCSRMAFATSNLVDAWNYSGNIVATTLETAQKSLKFPFCKRKYFYVYDIGWINLPNKQYEILSEVYVNPSLSLLARSQEHADCIERAWGRPVRAIIDDFNISKLVEVLREDERVP